MRAYVTIVVVLTVFSVLEAATIRVPQDQPTIQAGIDAAVDGDIVAVGPGVYYENISVMYRSLRLRRASASDSVVMHPEIPDSVCFSVIDCPQMEMTGIAIIGGGVRGLTVKNSVLTIDSCEVRGFTNRWTGAGIYVEGGRFKLRNSRIVSCALSHLFSWSGGAGVGLYAQSDSVEVTGCEFRSNCSFLDGGCDGGAVRIMGSHFRIESCSFVSNSASVGGALSIEGDSGYVVNSKILNNSATTLLDTWWAWGGAIAGSGADCEISNNVISQNWCSSSFIGGIVRWGGTGLQFSRNIVTRNYAEEKGSVSGGVFSAGSDAEVLSNQFTLNIVAVKSSFHGEPVASDVYGGVVWLGGGNFSNNLVDSNSLTLELTNNTYQTYIKGGFINMNSGDADQNIFHAQTNIVECIPPGACDVIIEGSVIYAGTSGVDMNCNLIWNNPANEISGTVFDSTSLFRNNPVFCSEAHRDTMVFSHSPALPDNNSCGLEIGSVIAGCSMIVGDVDDNSLIHIGDGVFIINFIFANGPAPYPIESGDLDCDDKVSIADAVYLINYIFAGGPPPCEP